ncbi:hypothetical protein GURASL_30070 [Geotalea uraniireducens]|uniref:Uncharacterized protein n=1 Tax=Geotalea uraniireducens TaxID=351604 RepID=A0ABM8ENB4_9BACT|nr:hypothetical protein [Geotalea uraniireducens]BDV44084.1 hypothetical protein GURASL_30070 [Geotalea uraniireducens]
MSDGERSSGGKTEDLYNEVACELKLLRSVVREIGESFILRREGEIETLLGCLETLPRKRVRDAAPEWLRELHRLKVKPHKGRLRDLKELDRLVGELMEQFMELQQETCGRPRRNRALPAPDRRAESGE